MNKNDVIQYYSNSIGRLNSRKINSSISDQDEYYKFVMKYTEFAPFRSFTDKLHLMKNDIYYNPTCKICNKETSFVRSENGKESFFRETCSSKCNGILKRGKSIIRDEKTANDKRKKTMIEKYGVEYNSQRKEIKEKLGLHNSDINFRKKQSEIQKSKHSHIRYDLLNDSNFLKTSNEKMSIYEISKVINGSISLIHQSFWKNNIEIRTHKSSLEIKIRNLLNSLGIDYIENDRTILNGKELDFYIPKFKVAIECNGLYWHSEIKISDKRYHINKTRQCNEKGIRLFQFFEHEINNKIDIIESMLRTAFNLNEKIYARKCIIKEVDHKTANLFINSNHMQGNTNAKIYRGLFYKDQLVSIISISKPRFNKDYDYEIIRFCSLKGYSIIGGFSKLLSEFKDKKLISYANMRWSNGNVYEKNDFNHLYDTDVGFFYFNGRDIKSRYSDRRTLQELYNDGYYRVFDCGNKVYEYIPLS